MEELNESKTPEVLESRAAVEEFEIAEVSLKNAAAQKQNNKKPIDWLKVGIAGTLACSVMSLGLSCAALIKKSNNNQNDNNQSSNVNYGESFTVSTDGYLVIDGVKTDVKIGSTSDIIDAEIKNVDKWGISTYIKFTFDDGSYMTTTPKEQVMNDHYYDASSADDLQALVAYGAPKVRLTSHVNLTSALELDSNLEVDLNNKTIMYTATAPIDVKEGVALRLANGNVTFNTPKAMRFSEASSLEIVDANISAQGTIAEVVGDDAKVEIFDSSISSTGKVVDVADTANNFALNVEGTELETADAGNVYVSTEEALLAAVANTEVESITLSTNIDLATAIEVSRTVTVDLNGKTLTIKNDTEGNGVFMATAGGNLTIEGEGVVNGICESVYDMALFATEGGKITINGGTYTNEGAGSDDQYDLIYASWGGEIVINGGTFKCHTPKWTLNLKDEKASTTAQEAGTIVVKGGTFYGYNPAASTTENPTANFVALGYKVVESNGVYTVVEEAGHIYAANAADFAAAVANTEVESITISANIDFETAVEITRTVTVDLNGKTLTIKNDTEGNGVFMATAGGHLIIEGEGVVNGICESVYDMALFATEGGKITINGGTYTNEGAGSDDQYDLIYASWGGEIVINGGTFKCHTPKWTLNLKDEKANTTAQEAGTIVVKGGTFYGYNPSASTTENPTANFVANGYKVVENNGVYTVVEAAGHAYASNEANFIAALADETVTTITVSHNMDLSTALEITRTVTVNLNGKTLTVSKDTEGNGVFMATAGGNLTIEGEGVVNGLGNNIYSMAVFATDGGKITINGGTYTNVGAGDDSHYDLIYASWGGEIVINGGTFTCHTPAWTVNQKDENAGTTAQEAGTIVVKGGTFTGFNPADCACEGEGTNFVAEGFTVVEDNGVFTVVAE